MSSPHHHSTSNVPVSRVDGPCLFHGTVGLAVAVVLEFVALFHKGDDRLLDALLQPVFHGEMPELLSLPLQLLLAAVFCYGIAFAVLDVAGTGKRAGLGITVLVLVLTMVPTFAVWNIYYSPFLPVVAVFWSWFFSMMYVNHHVMPCELAHRHKPTASAQSTTPPTSPTPMTPSNHLIQADDKVVVVEDEVAVEKKVAVIDKNRKYQPKERSDE